MSGAAGLRVAMVVYDDIALDSRIQREATSLAAAGYAVTVFCRNGSRETVPMLDPAVEVVAVPHGDGPKDRAGANPFHRRVSGLPGGAAIRRIRWLGSYGRSLWRWGRAVTDIADSFDVWHAHDFTGLVAISTRRTRRHTVVYDVHDLFTDTGTGARLPSPVRSVLRRVERRLVRRVDLVVTVNEALAQVIRRRYHPRSIAVVHNCPPRWSPSVPRPDLIRDATGVPGDAPIILYHGALGAERGVDRVCDALLEPGLENAHAVLLGFGPHRARYVGLAREARYGGRVHLLDPVVPSELLRWVESADVGVVVMQRTSLNLYLSTPNKLFECLAAGTPVVVSDFPSMRAIVAEDPSGPLGAVCDPKSVKDVARGLRDILGAASQDRVTLRQRCSSAAHERWNWETEAAALLDGYAALPVPRDSRTRMPMRSSADG